MQPTNIINAVQISRLQIQGSPKFVREVNDAFNLLKEKVPRLYAYGISGLSKIREVPAGSVIGVYVESRTFDLCH